MVANAGKGEIKLGRVKDGQIVQDTGDEMRAADDRGTIGGNIAGRNGEDERGE